MEQRTIQISYETYPSITKLAEQDTAVVEKAIDILKQSWSPYSQFRVGAAALLKDQSLPASANLENASYPVCLCAEHALLAYIHSHHYEVPIQTLAITAANSKGMIKRPAAPCGQCRQALIEAELRQGVGIRIILAASEQVIIVPSAQSLLPFHFDSSYF